LQELLNPGAAFETHSFKGGMTAFEMGTTRRFDTDKPDLSIRVGPVVIIDVASSLAQTTEPIVTEGVRLVHHRQSTHTRPITDALKSWGVPYTNALKTD